MITKQIRTETKTTISLTSTELRDIIIKHLIAEYNIDTDYSDISIDFKIPYEEFELGYVSDIKVEWTNIEEKNV